jgi:RimJ/RimL family protein N-acetyltransferase
MPLFSSPPAQPLDTPLVALRQLTSVCLDEVEAMVNNPETGRLTGTKKRFSRAELADWVASRPNQTNRCDWAILDVATGDFAGEIVLNELDLDKNSMNLRICLASPEWFNRGIGTAAIDAVMVFAFDELELSKLTLSVLLDNQRALHVYQKLGFVAGRQYNDGGLRYQRMSATKIDYVSALCTRQMTKPLEMAKWSFTFDSGKRRACLCDHTNRRISLSKHLVQLLSIEQSRQVLWHEIGHALVGANHGHDKTWLAAATKLGYKNEKFSGRTIDENQATWLGMCPNGHKYYRYKKPTGVASCSLCNRGFSPQHLITWNKRW